MTVSSRFSDFFPLLKIMSIEIECMDVHGFQSHLTHRVSGIASGSNVTPDKDKVCTENRWKWNKKQPEESLKVLVSVTVKSFIFNGQ